MSSPAIPGTKTQWRHWAKAVRQTVDRAPASELISNHLQAWLPPTATVMTYWAMPDEPDLSTLHHPGPVVVSRTPPGGGPLTLHDAGADTERHPYGYEQPVASSPERHPASVDVVLVPGVAFDRHGTRLGHGKGYYDELLARMRTDVVTVGVSFEALVVASLPTEAHDVPMRYLVTEAGISPSSPRSS